MNMVSNHFGHFLLVQLLLPTILKTEQNGVIPRIVQVNSCLAYKHSYFDFSEASLLKREEQKQSFMDKPYEKFHNYGQSKLAAMMCLTELDRQLREKGSKVPVNAVHPGEIFTDIFRDFGVVIDCLTKTFKPFVYTLLKTTYQGSRGSIFVATSARMATSDNMSGRFLMRLSPVAHNTAWLDGQACRKLWDISEELTGLKSGANA